MHIFVHHHHHRYHYHDYHDYHYHYHHYHRSAGPAVLWGKQDINLLYTCCIQKHVAAVYNNNTLHTITHTPYQHTTPSSQKQYHTQFTNYHTVCVSIPHTLSNLSRVLCPRPSAMWDKRIPKTPRKNSSTSLSMSGCAALPVIYVLWRGYLSVCGWVGVCTGSTCVRLHVYT